MNSPQDIVKDLESRALVTQLAGGDELTAHLAEGSRGGVLRVRPDGLRVCI